MIRAKMKIARLSVEIVLRDLRHEGSIEVWRGEFADVLDAHHLLGPIEASLQNVLLRHGVKAKTVEAHRD